MKEGRSFVFFYHPVVLEINDCGSLSKQMVVSFLKDVRCPSCFSFSPTFCTSLSRKGTAKKEEDDDDDEPDQKTEIKEAQDDSEDSDNATNRAKREDAEDLVRKARFNLEKLN